MNKEIRKKIKVSQFMWPYVQFVLLRDEISYEVKEKQTNTLLLSFGGSGKRFTEVLEDALCEKQRVESASNVPVYSYRTIRDHKKRLRLEKFYGRRGFHTLKQDYEKAHNYYA